MTGAKLELLCFLFICLCILSFLENLRQLIQSLAQTDKKSMMFHIYIGFTLHNSIVFHHHHHRRRHHHRHHNSIVFHHHHHHNSIVFHHHHRHHNSIVFHRHHNSIIFHHHHHHNSIVFHHHHILRFWYDSYRICPICAHQIPVDRKHLTGGFIWCPDCHAVKHSDSKTLKRIYYPPSEDEDD